MILDYIQENWKIIDKSVHYSGINPLEGKTKQTLIKRWKDKWNVVQSNKGVFFSHKGTKYWHKLHHEWTLKIC